MSYKFSFYYNRHWLYDYLLNFQGKNKSLADVKEDSINKLEEIFRQKGYGEHTRENWLKCSKEKKCSSECRDSNGFKNKYDIQYNRKKCVPYTRKMNPYIRKTNPKYKPDSKSWEPNDIYQYAYDFLTSYDSIVYTLNNWEKLQRNSSKSSNKNELNDNDKIIQYIVTYNLSNNIIDKILNGINIFRNEDYKKLVEKMKSTGLINRPFNYPNSNYNPYPSRPPHDPNTYVTARKGKLYELDEFDKRADELSNKNTPPTLRGGKNKSRKSRKNKKQRKTKKHNKSKKQRKTRKYRKSKK